MYGLTYQQQMEWRSRIEHEVKLRTDKNVTFIHPPMFYNCETPVSESEKCQLEKEIMDWDICQIKDSDILIVNLDNIHSSIGTHFELGVVHTINSTSDKHIYVIGIGNAEGELYPWIKLSLHRHENSVEEAADYITNYLLL